MCLIKKTPTSSASGPAAEAPAEQQDIGSKRAQENIDLFGGVPDLRVDQSATSGGIKADGSGLQMM